MSLKVLAAVAEHKSFAFVADRLSLSPAMTSKHVQHIEARVGARLLNRNSRNVSLTEAGERYLYAIYPGRSYLPANVRSFLDFLAGPNGLGKL